VRFFPHYIKAVAAWGWVWMIYVDTLLGKLIIDTEVAPVRNAIAITCNASGIRIEHKGVKRKNQFDFVIFIVRSFRVFCDWKPFTVARLKSKEI
jgi:hypothetical protein